MEPWGINTLLICFAGGIVGTALGALFSFVIVGFIVLVGCVVVINGGGDFILMQVGLGPIFGPHAGGFAAGIAAVTYAVAIKKNLKVPVLGLGGKDILSPLLDTSWDVMIVGGVFAVFGHALLQLLVMIPVINMADCIALSVMLTALVARAIFQKETPWGQMDSIKEHGYFSYPCQWIGWMNIPSKEIVFGFGVGIFSGALAWWAKGLLDPMVAAGTVSATGAFVVPLILCWSIAAIALIGLQLGTLTIEAQGEVQKVPVWHCQSILAALSYLLFGSILIAGIVGILSMFLQDYMGRMFWNHGSNHVDPPASAIAIGTLILNAVHKLF